MAMETPIWIIFKITSKFLRFRSRRMSSPSHLKRSSKMALRPLRSSHSLAVRVRSDMKCKGLFRPKCRLKNAAAQHGTGRFQSSTQETRTKWEKKTGPRQVPGVKSVLPSRDFFLMSQNTAKQETRTTWEKNKQTTMTKLKQETKSSQGRQSIKWDLKNGHRLDIVSHLQPRSWRFHVTDIKKTRMGGHDINLHMEEFIHGCRFFSVKPRWLNSSGKIRESERERERVLQTTP